MKFSGARKFTLRNSAQIWALGNSSACGKKRGLWPARPLPKSEWILATLPRGGVSMNAGNSRAFAPNIKNHCAKTPSVAAPLPGVFVAKSRAERPEKNSCNPAGAGVDIELSQV